MKKLYLFRLFLFSLISFTSYSQSWEAIGSASGISTGGAGRLTLLSDSQDNLFVGYYDSPAQKGNVQKYSAGAWSYLGDASGMTNSFATYNSFSAASDGVLYFTSQNSGLEVQKYQTGVWTQLASPTTSTINFQSSAVSPNNILFVTSNESAGTIKRYVSGNWEQVGTNGFFGGTPFFLDMVAGSNGKIYISFNNNGYVHVYENNADAGIGSAWTPVGGDANLAAASSSENYNSSLAIDNNNNLYLSYVSGSTGGNKLNVKKFNGTSWTQLGSENFSDGKVQHTSIAVTAGGTVYVAASVWENTDYLKNYVMAYNATANNWAQLGTGFVTDAQATFNSLTTDTSGNVYIAFADSGLGKLSVKKFTVTQTVEQTIEVATQNSVPSEITTNAGILQLTATVTPTAAPVTWVVTEGAEYATVDANGLVTANANGTVTVKAALTADATVYDEITITITNQTVAVTAVTVTVEDAAAAEITTNGGTLQLVATVTPENATDTDVTWAITTGSDYAAIDENGLVTATANGTVTVTVTTADGEYTDTIEIVINGQTVAVTAVAITVEDNAAAEISTNGGTLQLFATVTPEDATDTSVTWAITNGSDYATIDENGLVTATANGTITVTVTTADGEYTDTIEIVITGQTIAVTAVTVTVEDNAVAEITTNGGTLQLIATVTPEDATDTNVIWSVVSGSEFASVDENGLVTAIANGEAVIRATSATDDTIYGEITVTIDIETAGITEFNNNSFSVYPNPSKDSITITTIGTEISSITVYSLIGQQLFVKEYQQSNTVSLSLENLQPGTYLLNIASQKGSVTKKIVKL